MIKLFTMIGVICVGVVLAPFTFSASIPLSIFLAGVIFAAK